MNRNYLIGADALLTARRVADQLAATPRRQFLRRRVLRAELNAACVVGDAHRPDPDAVGMLPLRVIIRNQTGV